MEVIRENGARFRYRNDRTYIEVPGATDDLLRSFASVNLTHPDLVSIRMSGDIGNHTYVNVGPISIEILHAVDREAEHVERVAQLGDILSRKVDELGQPPKGDLH